MEPGTFDEVYQSYFDSVYRYVLSLSRNPHVAEEITQEAFFKALRSLDQFRGDSSMKSWLCTIAKNIWVSEQRKKKAQPIDETSALPDPGLSPEESIVRQDESMRILSRLADLVGTQKISLNNEKRLPQGKSALWESFYLPLYRIGILIQKQKKQGRRPAKNPRSGLLLTEELLQ